MSINKNERENCIINLFIHFTRKITRDQAFIFGETIPKSPFALIHSITKNASLGCNQAMGVGYTRPSKEGRKRRFRDENEAEEEKDDLKFVV